MTYLPLTKPVSVLFGLNFCLSPVKDCHIRDNPKANCQLFAELKLIIGKEWQDIANTVGSPQASLRSHWNRKCEPLLQKWLAENQKLFGEENNDR